MHLCYNKSAYILQSVGNYLLVSNFDLWRQWEVNHLKISNIYANGCKLWWLVLTQLLFLCVAGSMPGGRSEDTSSPYLIVTMVKRHILIDPTQPSTSNQSRPPPRTKWELCILCQAETGEPLQCPLRYTMKLSGVAYASLTEDLVQFMGLRYMPMELNVNRLDDGDGVEATLRRHIAQWHKKCLKL